MLLEVNYTFELLSFRKKGRRLEFYMVIFLSKHRLSEMKLIAINSSFILNILADYIH